MPPDTKSSKTAQTEAGSRSNSGKKTPMDTNASRPPPMVGGKWTNAAQAAQPTLKHARVEPQRPTTAHKLQKGAKQSQKKPNGAMDSPWAAMAARGGPWSAKEARRDTKRHHRKPWVPHGHWVQHQGHAPETRNTHTHTQQSTHRGKNTSQTGARRAMPANAAMGKPQTTSRPQARQKVATGWPPQTTSCQTMAMICHQLKDDTFSGLTTTF